MAVLRYNGPWDQRELWGVTFQQGRTVEVDDPKLVTKALSLEGFERVDMVEPEPAPKALDPAPDDYPADTVQPAGFDDLKIPQVGSGTIPENWRDMHWKQRVKLAKELSGMDDISTTEAADATIEALLEAK
jgi:hypothetical protein